MFIGQTGLLKPTKHCRVCGCAVFLRLQPLTPWAALGNASQLLQQQQQRTSMLRCISPVYAPMQTQLGCVAEQKTNN